MSVAATPPVIRKSRPLLRVATAAALVVGSLFAWRPIGDWQQRRFAMQLAQRATESESIPQAIAAVNELWSLGLPATAPLARMAAMQRAEIAAAAQQALANQLATWEIELEAGGDRAAFAARLTELSGLISAHADHLNAAGQLWAKKLSRQMTADCGPLESDDAWAILRACDRVASLRTPNPPRSQATATRQSATRTHAEFAAVTSKDPLPTRLAQAPDAAPLLAPLNPSELAPPPRLPARLDVVLSGPPHSITPTAPAESGPSGNPLREPVAASKSAAAPASAEPDQPVAPAETAPFAVSSPVGADVPSPLDMRRLRQQLRQHSDLQLMSLVESAPRFEAAAAQEILRTRGYTVELLQMTRELRRLPPLQRRAALERASDLPPAESRLLLRWFVADEDAEVRLQALSLLATAGDPQLEALARQRAVDDPDPRVADLATKLLQK